MNLSAFKVFFLIFIVVSISACSSAPAIHRLTDLGTLAEVEAELAAGADPNIWHAGYYPLQNAIYYHAADEHQIPIVKALIENGAYVDGPSGAYWSPLHFAAVSCNPDIIDILIDAGATIDKRNGQGNTSLYVAVEYERQNCAYKLIDRGANLYVSGNNGKSILQQASSKNGIDGNALVARYEQAQDQLTKQKSLEQAEAIAIAEQSEKQAQQQRMEATWNRDLSLPADIRRDKYLVAFSNSMKQGNYADADFYAQLLERNQVGLESSLYYFWGEALLRTNQPEAALEKLNGYLTREGSSGQYYSQALSLILEAEANL